MRDAIAKAADLPVSRETYAMLETYVSLLAAAAAVQNLVARSTLDGLWERHIIDSAQLIRFAPSGGDWTDVGSGAGLPGLVIAILTGAPCRLIEPRRLRAQFLQETVQTLGLSSSVEVCPSKVERVTGVATVLTGRAVASLDRFIAMTEHLAQRATTWIIPKGRNAESELAEARLSWHCEARVERSCTDPDSRILVLTKVGAINK